MSEVKFTKGNWSFGDQNGHCGISINCDEGSRIATVYLGLVTSRFKRGDEHFNLDENKESVANAHLIAAAPEMYELLHDLSEMNGYELAGFIENSDALIELLAKARGEK